MAAAKEVTPATAQDPTEFNSWKEIANHLGVSVRRAQQWEKELQLPVRRFKLGSRARLGATRADLDEWRRQRTGVTATIVEGPARAPGAGCTPATPEPAALVARRRRWRTPLIVFCVAVGLAVVTIARAVHWPERHPASAAIVDGRLRVSDSEGRVLWQIEFPEGDAGIPTPQVAPARVGGFWISNTHVIDDLDGDSASEVLFVLNRHGSSGVPVGDRVFCFGEDGRVRWRFTPGRPLSWGGRVFDGEYFVAWVVGPFLVGHRRMLAVGAQNTFFPFQVSLLDAATGQLVGEYWHVGGLGAALVDDWDGDGATEILAGGVNNPGPGPGLPALVRLRTSSLRPLAVGGDVFEQGRSSETDYLLFPSLNGLERDDVPRRIAWMTIGQGGTVQLGVSFGPRFQDRGQVYYTLDANLRVLDAHPCDLLRAYHGRLVEDGYLRGSLTEEHIAAWRDVRRFPNMPNANRPEIRALWAPAPASTARRPAGTAGREPRLRREGR